MYVQYTRKYALFTCMKKTCSSPWIKFYPDSRWALILTLVSCVLCGGCSTFLLYFLYWGQYQINRRHQPHDTDKGESGELWRGRPPGYISSPSQEQRLKGIVSGDWEQIQWIPSDKSEECRVAGAYFFLILMSFSCFNLKNACFGGFSFDSYSANDK
jgi:hypothetical protein